MCRLGILDLHFPSCSWCVFFSLTAFSFSWPCLLFFSFLSSSTSPCGPRTVPPLRRGISSPRLTLTSPAADGGSRARARCRPSMSVSLTSSCPFLVRATLARLNDGRQATADKPSYDDAQSSRLAVFLTPATGAFTVLYGLISIKIKRKWYLGEACMSIPADPVFGTGKGGPLTFAQCPL